LDIPLDEWRIVAPDSERMGEEHIYSERKDFESYCSTMSSTIIKVSARILNPSVSLAVAWHHVMILQPSIAIVSRQIGTFYAFDYEISHFIAL
jgi:hypothetical protein